MTKHEEAVEMFKQAQAQQTPRRQIAYGKIGGPFKAIGNRVRIKPGKGIVQVSSEKGLYNFK